jgi:hypothetical protein
MGQDPYDKQWSLLDMASNPMNIRAATAQALREFGEMYADVSPRGDGDIVVIRAMREARRLESRYTTARIPNRHTLRCWLDKTVRGAVFAVVIAGSIAQARAEIQQSVASETCAGFRSDRPDIKAPLAITCHVPVVNEAGALIDRPVHFRCAALPGGERQSPMPAEVFDGRCGESAR